MVLSDEQIKQQLLALRGWEYSNGKIEKTYRLAGFLEAVDAVNKISVVAEHVDHHPDVSIHDYNQLTVSAWTHDENGVTDKDIKLASEVEKLMALTV